MSNGTSEMTEDEKKNIESYDKYRQEFISAMDDEASVWRMPYRVLIDNGCCTDIIRKFAVNVLIS